MRTPLLVLLISLASVGSAACRSSNDDSPNETPAPVDPTIQTLLGNLRVGQPLAELRVAAIRPVTRGMFVVSAVDKDRKAVEISVALVGEGPLAPVTTKKYALFYGSAVGDAGVLDAGKITPALEALAERIRKTEDTAATPAGMTSYGAVGTNL